MVTPKHTLKHIRDQLLGSEDAALAALGDLATDRQLDMLYQALNYYAGDLKQHNAGELFRTFLQLDRATGALCNEIQRIEQGIKG